LCEEKGLLDPEFTWVGSYHLSRTFFVFDDESEDDRRLQKLITSMIFHRVVPVVLPAATELWDDHAESAVVSAVLEGQFEELVDDTVWWAEAKGQFLTEFAVAYDTMWLAASAFSKCGGGKSIGLEGTHTRAHFGSRGRVGYGGAGEAFFLPFTQQCIALRACLPDMGWYVLVWIHSVG
jgi:hypothetical protein